MVMEWIMLISIVMAIIVISLCIFLNSTKALAVICIVYSILFVILVEHYNNEYILLI